MGRSFEAELGVAQAKAEEQKYKEQAGGAEEPKQAVLDALDAPELPFESKQDERDRINRIRMKTMGKPNESHISEEALQAQGIEKGVNPGAKGVKEDITAQEYFAQGELDPLVESSTLAEIRAKDPAKAERYATLKRDRVSRQADIGRLKDQIDAQTDETMKAAQTKVLAQFQRELKTLENELEELEKSI